MESHEIISRLQKEIPKLLANSLISLAYLYGSLAREQATLLSDVDIALVTEQPLSPLARLDLELDIEMALAALGILQANVRVINKAISWPSWPVRAWPRKSDNYSR